MSGGKFVIKQLEPNGHLGCSGGGPGCMRDSFGTDSGVCCRGEPVGLLGRVLIPGSLILRNKIKAGLAEN